MDALYHLTFDDFCDWYAEAIKPRLYDGDADAQATALANLEHLLKLLHPVMPHVTEEIWSQFHDDRLIVAPWPESRAADEADLRALDRVQDAARLFRRSGTLIELDEEERRIFDAVVKPERAKADGGNLEAELERLRGEIARAEGMLANERFVANAPGDVVEAEREKLERYRRELDALPLDWLESLSPWPEEFGLGRMHALLAELGEPQRAYPAIHVVGTNGKSTATRRAAAFLAREGLSVGAYTSPHVSGWAERIQVDGEDAGLEAALVRVREPAERLGATQFEVLTAAALAEFAAAGVDVAVVEAGLGGRHDATNVLDAPWSC